MRSKKDIENELTDIKNQLKLIDNDKSSPAKSNTIDDDNTNLLFNYLISENKKTTLLLDSISKRLEKLEEELNDDDDDVDDYNESPNEDIPIKRAPQSENNLEEQKKEIMLSDVDIKILQIIQLSYNSMVSADDVSKKMGYKGKNAASSRLNKLYKIGMIDRYQLGHKVYYKYDAGKTTNTLIVSPPQY